MISLELQMDQASNMVGCKNYFRCQLIIKAL